MDRHFDLKINGESVYIPKYIKSKVYYIKGWKTSYLFTIFIASFFNFIFVFIDLIKLLKSNKIICAA